jgi:hypothetical protein
MPVRGILRKSTPAGDATDTNAPIYVDSDDNLLKFIPAGSGSTEVTLLDSAHTVQDTVVAYAADGAIAPTAGTAKLTKAGVGAYTLAAPTALQEGTYLTIINNTANAHVVTATGLLDDGVTGGSKNTATFAAFAGAAITLCAIGLKWSVVSKNVVTVA